MKDFLSILIFNWKDITNPAAGGGTYYTHKMAKYLVENGHEVTLLCANYRGGLEREIIDGVNVIRVGNRYTVYTKAPIRFLKDFKGKCDVVIDEINVLPWLTPLYMRIPKIAFIHQTTKEALFEELNGAVANVICSVEKIGLLFYRKAVFITVSQSVKQELIDNGIPRKNISVVSPGIDMWKYERTSGEKTAFPLVLYLGRLKKYKGVHYLVQAMKHVITTMPEAKLAILGEGDYRSELEKLVETLNLQDNVTFYGYVSDEEKIRFLKKAWVLVVPSVKEGFGIVVIEAAVCGTPTIGTDTMGLKDSIIHGKTGFLVPYGKPVILAQKICQMLDDDELRNRFAKNAGKWGRSFTWEKTLKGFEMIIRKTVASVGD